MLDNYWLYFPHCVSYLWVIYFAIWNVYLLISSSISFFPLWQPPVCLHIYNYFWFVYSFVLFLYSTYKWYHTIFAFLLDLFSIIYSRSTCCHRQQDLFFHAWIIFYYTYIDNNFLIHSLIDGLFPYLCHNKY